MSNKFTNNVRTRLYKQGYQGFTKDDFTSAALAVDCDNLDEPTKEQINQAVDYLKEKSMSLPAVVSPTEQLLEELVQEAPEEPVENKTQDVIGELTQSGQLATTDETDVGQLVTSKASEMSVVLSEQQINEIADSVDTSANTFDEILDQVEQALLAYADHSADSIDTKIDQTLDRVQQRVVNRHEQSRERLAQRLTLLGAALESSRNQTKSQLTSILARLKTV
jgi:DNA anti-recombination protein RmuC